MEQNKVLPPHISVQETKPCLSLRILTGSSSENPQGTYAQQSGRGSVSRLRHGSHPAEAPGNPCSLVLPTLSTAVNQEAPPRPPECAPTLGVRLTGLRAPHQAGPALKDSLYMRHRAAFPRLTLASRRAKSGTGPGVHPGQELPWYVSAPGDTICGLLFSCHRPSGSPQQDAIALNLRNEAFNIPSRPPGPYAYSPVTP